MGIHVPGAAVSLSRAEALPRPVSRTQDAACIFYQCSFGDYWEDRQQEEEGGTSRNVTDRGGDGEAVRQ